MPKVRVALIAILIAAVAFVSCDRAQKMLEPAAEDMMATDDKPMDMTMEMMKMIDLSMYMSWASVTLPAPAPMAEAASPIETGAAHNPAHTNTGITTARTVYINEAGALANQAGTAYPAGTVIIKEIMDDTETFVDKVAVMMKSDDEMYAGHNGWVYKKYARSSEDAEYMQVKGSNLEDAGNGCHGCHAQANTDSVFVSLSMDDIEGMDSADAGDGNGTSAGATGGDANADAGNGNGNGDGDAQ